MLGKIAMLLFVAATCRAEFSAQNVIHHASPPRHPQPSHGYAPQPQQLHGYPPAGPPQHIYQAYAPSPSKGHAVSSQSFVSHQSPSKPSYSYGGPSGLHGQSSGGHYQEEYGHPVYEFKYSVSDPHTGDQKSQFESRDGDSTKGEYSLLQPDGKVRTVVYHVDKHSGFNAHVSYSHPKSHAGY